MPGWPVWRPTTPARRRWRGRTAADIYDLDILERCIEDEPGNTTRFLVIGTEDARPSGEDKTSLLISAHNEAGSSTPCWSPS